MNTIPLTGRQVVAVPLVPKVPPEPPSSAVQALWFATQRKPWQILALLAPDLPGEVGLLATAFATVGRLTNSGEVDLLNTQGAKLRELSWYLSAIAQARARGSRLVVAADSVVGNPVSLPLVSGADAIVLVMAMGRSHLANALKSIELVGRERVIGCVVVGPRVAI